MWGGGGVISLYLLGTSSMFKQFESKACISTNIYVSRVKLPKTYQKREIIWKKYINASLKMTQYFFFHYGVPQSSYQSSALAVYVHRLCWRGYLWVIFLVPIHSDGRDDWNKWPQIVGIGEQINVSGSIAFFFNVFVYFFTRLCNILNVWPWELLIK